MTAIYKPQTNPRVNTPPEQFTLHPGAGATSLHGDPFQYCWLVWWHDGRRAEVQAFENKPAAVNFYLAKIDRCKALLRPLTFDPECFRTPAQFTLDARAATAIQLPEHRDQQFPGI